MFQSHRTRGQGLVEFALILPALMVILFSIIEGAFLFQAYLAVQHAAREGARYAVTYQPPRTYSQEQGEELLRTGSISGNPDFKGETDTHWDLRRTQLIREHAYYQSMGIRILYPAIGFFEDHSSEVTIMPNDQISYGRDSAWDLLDQAGFFGVRVSGFPDPTSADEFDHPSQPGLPVRVEVWYRWEPLDPIIKVIVPNGVLLTGEAIMINEGLQVGIGPVSPPTFAPTPTLPPVTRTPGTPRPTNTPSATDTPSPTGTPPPTPTLTPTPEWPYILLVPDRDQWLLEEFVDNPPWVELYNHPDGTYYLYWNDNCGGPDVPLGHSVSSSSGYGPGNLPSGFDYLSSNCGDPIPQGVAYDATLKTKRQENGNLVDVASVTVPIYVPFQRPDLIVRDILFIPPGAETEGGEFIIGVLIENIGEVEAAGTFDVDIYVNPSHEPVLKGLPGLGTAGGSSPKQWWTGTVSENGGQQIVSFVVNIPPAGDHTIWAQVDTSDLIDETNDENNIFGNPPSENPQAPKELHFACSEQCDDFEGTLVKWEDLATIGTDCSGTGGAQIQEGTLIINGTGCTIFDEHDGRFYFLHQGQYSDGDFDMRIQVLVLPDMSWAKAGLMVRESLATGARYVAISVAWDGSQSVYQSIDRTSGSGDPTERCRGAISSSGDGFWLRIVREGDTFTKYTSVDGSTWSTDESCMTTTFSGGFVEYAYPGVFMAPY